MPVERLRDVLPLFLEMRGQHVVHVACHRDAVPAYHLNDFLDAVVELGADINLPPATGGYLRFPDEPLLVFLPPFFRRRFP